MKKENQEQKPAAEEPKAITLESNVGLCGVRISAILKDNAELAAKFLGFFLWHDGASAVFNGGKKAKYARNSPYSDEFGEHTKSRLLKVLAPFFDVQSIETFAEIKESEQSKFMTFCKKLGMTEEAALAGWTTAQASKAKAEEKPVEVKEVVLQ